MTAVVAATGGNISIADCGAGNHVTGGGGIQGSSGSGLDASYPSNSTGTAVTGANPRYWTATFSNNNAGNKAYAICVPN